MADTFFRNIIVAISRTAVSRIRIVGVGNSGTVGVSEGAVGFGVLDDVDC